MGIRGRRRSEPTVETSLENLLGICENHVLGKRLPVERQSSLLFDK